MEQQQYLQHNITTLQQDYDAKSHFVMKEQEESVPFVRVDSAISTTIARKNIITIDLEHPDSYTYLPGEVINGAITVDPYNFSAYNNRSNNKGRVDVHLACSFRIEEDDEIDFSGSSNKKKLKKRKQSIFKVMMNPIYLSKETNQSNFSLNIPTDLPAYNANDESVHGRIEYKIKAIYELSPDLPLSLYPKTSKPIFVSARISATDPVYLIPMQIGKEITITIPRDITLKTSKKLRKGEKGRVSTKLYLPTSCFLPGDSIPFSLEIQHIAPIKQLQGIQVTLERITRVQYDGVDSIETTMMKKSILPFICDSEDNHCVIAPAKGEPALVIPEGISPSTSTNIMPLDMGYKLKVLINMDMQHHFLEDAPVRKRDRAYSMVTKMMGSLELDGDGGPAFFYGTTIELELPITVGTTRGQQHSLNTTCSATAAAKIISRNRLSLPTKLSSSSSSLIVTSPENLLPLPPPQHRSAAQEQPKLVNRFDSDPSFNRRCHSNNSSIYSLVQRQQNPSLFLSTPSLLSIGNTLTERPPSAPALTDLLLQQQEEDDQRSPPPYLE